MLEFGRGETNKNIAVPSLDRSRKAPSRGYYVTLRSPGNAAIVDNTGVVTIGASGAPAVASPGISAPPDVVVGEVGRASCRERVEISAGGGSLEKEKEVANTVTIAQMGDDNHELQAIAALTIYHASYDE